MSETLGNSQRLRILVTRPAGQADSFLQRLKSQGLEGVTVPLLEIVPLEDKVVQKKIRQKILNLDNYQQVIAISSNAAEHFVDKVQEFWPQWPLLINWLAVGEKTAEVLRAEDLEVISPTLMSSEGLLALPQLQDVQDQKILICCGEGGRTLIQDGLTQRGATVERCELYRRVLPGEAVNNLANAGQLDMLLVNSGETLIHLTKLCEQMALQKNMKCLPLVVPSERVAKQAEDLAWLNIIVADNAADDAMLAAIKETIKNTREFHHE